MRTPRDIPRGHELTTLAFRNPTNTNNSNDSVTVLCCSISLGIILMDSNHLTTNLYTGYGHTQRTAQQQSGVRNFGTATCGILSILMMFANFESIKQISTHHYCRRTNIAVPCYWSCNALQTMEALRPEKALCRAAVSGGCRSSGALQYQPRSWRVAEYSPCCTWEDGSTSNTSTHPRVHFIMIPWKINTKSCMWIWRLNNATEYSHSTHQQMEIQWNACRFVVAIRLKHVHQQGSSSHEGLKKKQKKQIKHVQLPTAPDNLDFLEFWFWAIWHQ